jgi:hypothetical protein
VFIPMWLTVLFASSVAMNAVLFLNSLWMIRDFQHNVRWMEEQNNRAWHKYAVVTGALRYELKKLQEMGVTDDN